MHTSLGFDESDSVVTVLGARHHIRAFIAITLTPRMRRICTFVRRLTNIATNNAIFASDVGVFRAHANVLRDRAHERIDKKDYGSHISSKANHIRFYGNLESFRRPRW